MDVESHDDWYPRNRAGRAHVNTRLCTPVLLHKKLFELRGVPRPGCCGVRAIDAFRSIIVACGSRHTQAIFSIEA
jgi:hypothetical protein